MLRVRSPSLTPSFLSSGIMSTISFESKLFKIKDWTILHLTPEASDKLPSRGMIMVKGTMNGVPFKTLLEPDGRYAPGRQTSHWFRPDKKLLDDARAAAGDTVRVSLEPTKEWIEPEVPEDLKKALSTSQKAEDLWMDITPMARWDWIRWIRAVKTPETRQKHIEVVLSKLNKGTRRPCCFNRNLCSEPYVSHNWVLLEPAQTIL
ncbi:MAG TPA: YdeI/OmpD-associated family protein [Patescibacteria group bacterium]|nr:YdeI/OmpD-associated family protein [Patescibacteria group bacterium]